MLGREKCGKIAGLGGVARHAGAQVLGKGCLHEREELLVSVALQRVHILPMPGNIAGEGDGLAISIETVRP